MNRKILWSGGMLDEIELVYKKAEADASIDNQIEKLENQALEEAKAACGEGGILTEQVGAVLTSEQFDAMSALDKETAVVMLGQIGFGKYSRNDKIIISLSPMITRTMACTVFRILNQLEKLDGAVTTIKPKWTLELQVPLGGKNGLFQCEMLIMKLYPWISVVETSTNQEAVDFAKGYSDKPETEDSEKNKGNIPAFSGSDNDFVWILMNSSMPDIPAVDYHGSVNVITDKSSAEKMAAEIGNGVTLKQMTWGEFNRSFIPELILWGCKKVSLYKGTEVSRIMELEPSVEFLGSSLCFQAIRYLQIAKSKDIDLNKENVKGSLAIFKNLFKDELDKTFLFVPVVYSDDSEMDSSSDKGLHFFPDAASMVKSIGRCSESDKNMSVKLSNDKIFALQGTAGYNTATSSGKIMNMRLIKAPDGSEYIPCFTSLDELRIIFRNSRVGFAALSDMADLMNNNIKGIVLNPCSLNFELPPDLLKPENKSFNIGNKVVSDAVTYPVNVPEKVPSEFPGSSTQFPGEGNSIDLDLDFGENENNVSGSFDLFDTDNSDIVIPAGQFDINSPINQPQISGNDNEKKLHNKRDRIKTADSGKNSVKSKIKKIVLIVICLAVFVIACFIGYNAISTARYRAGEEMEWSKIIDTNLLPLPESNRGRDNSYDNKVYIEVCKTTSDQYNQYVAECKKMGYTVDADLFNNEYGDDYTAYNSLGYKLTLYYYDYDEEMDIILEKPLSFYEMKWPEKATQFGLPDPGSEKMIIDDDSYDLFSAKIGDISYDSFRSYARQCFDSGYNFDISGSKISEFEAEKMFSSDYTGFGLYDSVGRRLILDYLGNNSISIELKED